MTKKDYVFLAELFAMLEMGYMSAEDLRFYLIQYLGEDNSKFDGDEFAKYIQDLRNEVIPFKYF